MTDIPRATLTGLPSLYQAAFENCTSTLPIPRKERLRRTAGVLIRSRRLLCFQGDRLKVTVETVFSQPTPYMWRYHSQMVSTKQRSSHARELRQWTRSRAAAFDAHHGSQMMRILHIVAEALTMGREGRDWIMLKRIPALADPVPAVHCS